jgi:hypothetical protein|nr:MAG TPA: hypothetical protein [Caudoviricetes sp.]
MKASDDMKRVDSKKDWEQIITIELPLKQLKLIRDSMYQASYAELENLNKGKDIPYAYSDLEKSIGEADDILGV